MNDAVRWTPAYTKTFDDAGALDELKLAHIWDDVINNELQQYVAECVTLGEHPETGDPCMILTCRKTPETVEGQKLAKGQPYLSGIATSYTSQDFGPYFKIEADIWLPKGMGLWPAFWLLSLGKNKRWPDGQDQLHEIDPLEKLGREDGNWIHCTSHLMPGSWDDKGHKHWPNAVDIGEDTYAGFHRYGVAVCPSGVYFYFDDEEVCANPLPEEYMDLKWHWLANLAIGGQWAQAPDETTPDESSMYVRSVEAWDMEGVDLREPVATADSKNNNLAAPEKEKVKPDDQHAGLPPVESTDERELTLADDQLMWPTFEGETRWNVYLDGVYVTTTTSAVFTITAPGVYVVEGISDPTPGLKVD